MLLSFAVAAELLFYLSKGNVCYRIGVWYGNRAMEDTNWEPCNCYCN